MEKFVAKAEINIYGIATISKAKDVLLNWFYATYQEAYTIFKSRYIATYQEACKIYSDSTALNSSEPDKLIKFIHHFVIPKGAVYSRDGVNIFCSEAVFVKTIYNIELYGKNESK